MAGRDQPADDRHTRTSRGQVLIRLGDEPVVAARTRCRACPRGRREPPRKSRRRRPRYLRHGCSPAGNPGARSARTHPLSDSASGWARFMAIRDGGRPVHRRRMRGSSQNRRARGLRLHCECQPSRLRLRGGAAVDGRVWPAGQAGAPEAQDAHAVIAASLGETMRSAHNAPRSRRFLICLNRIQPPPRLD